MAVQGSERCERHGGAADTRTPERMRKRLDRPQQRCTATKRDGTPCNGYAVMGSYVCLKHGGNLPSVRKAAAERMVGLLFQSVEHLKDIIEKPDTSDADRLKAIALVLDRTGLGAKSEVTLEVKKYEQVFQGIARIAAPSDDDVYTVTDAEPPAPPSATTGDDSGADSGADGLLNPVALLDDQRLPRRKANPPPHLR